MSALDPLSWHEIARRHAAGEPLEHLADEFQAADNERYRAMLADMGPRGLDALRRFDAAMRDVDSGVTGARNCWQSLSPAQRRVCLFLAPGRVLVRSARIAGYYDAVPVSGCLDTIAKAARLDTVRALARHGLVQWDGTATDPEARAVGTERMRFVAEYGQATP